jgi:hypothetical protein
MDEERARPRRGRALLTVLAVAAAVAAVPAGVALAGSGDSGQASGSEAPSGGGTTEVQSEAPDRGDGDRRDCPKDRQGDEGGGAPNSGEEGSSFPGYGPPDTTQL